jgi:hypothetical protein
LADGQKSAELKKAEGFLELVLRNPDQALAEDPCLSVGDLLIALESLGTPTFFTLNSAESQHLCRALDQTLIVQPIDPTKEQIVCLSTDEKWPAFGKK